MRVKEYQEKSKRTLATLGEDKDRQHMIFGVITEIAEIADLYKKNMAYGRELDINKVKEEFGDCLYYVSGLATTFNQNLKEPKVINIPTEGFENVSIADYVFYLFKDLEFANAQRLLNKIYSFYVYLGFSEESFGEILKDNVAKLEKRYSKTFTKEEAIIRKDYNNNKNIFKQLKDKIFNKIKK